MIIFSLCGSLLDLIVSCYYWFIVLVKNKIYLQCEGNQQWEWCSYVHIFGELWWWHFLFYRNWIQLVHLKCCLKLDALLWLFLWFNNQHIVINRCAPISGAELKPESFKSSIQIARLNNNPEVNVLTGHGEWCYLDTKVTITFLQNLLVCWIWTIMPSIDSNLKASILWYFYWH